MSDALEPAARDADASDRSSGGDGVPTDAATAGTTDDDSTAASSDSRSGDSAAAASGAPSWRPMLHLLGIWMVLPTLTRPIVLADWLLGPHDVAHPLLWFLAGVAMGTVQDAFVAGQAALALLGVRCLTRRWPRVWHLAGWLLFLPFALYVATDVMLALAIDLRMTSSFWHFFLDAEAFWDSVDDVGVWKVVAVFAVLIGLSGAAFWRNARRVADARLHRAHLRAAVPISLAAIGTAVWGPGELMYMSNNVVLADQIDATKRVLGIEDELLEHAAGLDGGDIWQPTFETEVSERLGGEDHPMWRRTDGFRGETTFDLRVDPDERPHVVLLVLESFRAKDAGAYAGVHDVTPNFDRFADEGVFFTDFYASGVQTTRAVIGLLFGVLPRFEPESLQAVWPRVPLHGLADIFHERGYHTAYLYNGELDFESMQEFFEHHTFDSITGEDDMEAAFPGAARFSWGVHDEYLMRYALDWLEEKDRAGTPSFVTMFTISNHHPWELPDHWDPIDVDVPADETWGKFLRGMHYSDHALGMFVDGLRERGLAENTILVITADTSQAMGDRNESFNVSRALYYENVRVPLLLLADGRIEPGRVTDPGGQSDVLLTVLDAMGIAGATHHSTGESLRRSNPDRMVFFQSPFALKYFGVRQGRWKYWYELESEKHHLYDVEADPGENHNLADARPAIVERYFTAVARAHRLHHVLYEREGWVP